MAGVHSEEIKKIKIFIAENVPSLNKGEMSILEGMLESFKILGKVEVTMLSDMPQIDQPRYGIKVKIIDVKKALHLPDGLITRHRIFKIFISFSKFYNWNIFS